MAIIYIDDRLSIILVLVCLYCEKIIILFLKIFFFVLQSHSILYLWIDPILFVNYSFSYFMIIILYNNINSQQLRVMIDPSILVHIKKYYKIVLVKWKVYFNDITTRHKMTIYRQFECDVWGYCYTDESMEYIYKDIMNWDSKRPSWWNLE